MLILDLLPLLLLFGVVVRRDLGNRGRMRFGGVRLRGLVLAGRSAVGHFLVVKGSMRMRNGGGRMGTSERDAMKVRVSARPTCTL